MTALFFLNVLFKLCSSFGVFFILEEALKSGVFYVVLLGFSFLGSDMCFFFTLGAGAAVLSVRAGKLENLN